MTYEQTIARAEEIGAEHGTGAASWYFDGNTDLDTYRTVLAGMNDGDPMILDTLPSSSLSGEWADSYSLADLASDLDTSQDTDAWDDYCNAYEDAFSRACDDEIGRVCHFHLDPSEAVSALDTDAAYKVAGYNGAAWRIIRTAGGDAIELHMIGDDATFTFDVDDLEPITDEDYCHECGQIGCTADGR